MNPDEITQVNGGRPVVFRNATVLTMDDAGIIEDGDVLVTGDTIAAVGPQPRRAGRTPSRSTRRAASLMPGMVDTHRHMWQTALRGLGADWTLTQYFVFYYLSWGKIFRPQDIACGQPALRARSRRRRGHDDAGLVARTADDRARRGCARRAAQLARPVRPRLRQPARRAVGVDELGRLPQLRRPHPDPTTRSGCNSPSTSPATRRSPRRGAFEAARELGLRVTTHAGVWGATNDDSIRLMWEGGFMTPDVTYVHAATLTEDSYQRIAASGGTASVSTESEQSAGQGYPPTWALRKHGIPVSLSMDTSVWWSADLFSAMRATLSADRSREHLEAHARGETVVHNRLRAEEVAHWATIGGARALGLDDRIGSLTPGKKADVVLIKNDDSPAMYPMLHPYGTFVYQAGRGDVHTVLVDGRVVQARAPAARRRPRGGASDAVAQTVDYARSTMGEDAWRESITPELPDRPTGSRTRTRTPTTAAAATGTPRVSRTSKSSPGSSQVARKRAAVS